MCGTPADGIEPALTLKFHFARAAILGGAALCRMVVGPAARDRIGCGGRGLHAGLRKRDQAEGEETADHQRAREAARNVRTAMRTTCSMRASGGGGAKLNRTGLNSVDWQASMNWAAATSQSSTTSVPASTRRWMYDASIAMPQAGPDS